MAINSKDLIGGDGLFLIKFFSGQLEIPIGSSGDILVITPPDGQKVRLTGLGVFNTPDQPNISVVIGGVTVASDMPLSEGMSFNKNTLCVNAGVRSKASSAGSGGFIGGTNESITVKIVAGSTATIVYYSYEFGE